MVNLNIEYLPSINFSLINNRIAICQSVEICNNETYDLKDLIIECRGDFFQDYRSSVIPSLKAGRSIRLQGMDLSPITTQVAAVTEKLPPRSPSHYIRMCNPTQRRSCFAIATTLTLCPLTNGWEPASYPNA